MEWRLFITTTSTTTLASVDRRNARRFVAGTPYHVPAAYEEYIVDELQGAGHIRAKRIHCDFRGVTHPKYPEIKLHSSYNRQQPGGRVIAIVS